MMIHTDGAEAVTAASAPEVAASLDTARFPYMGDPAFASRHLQLSPVIEPTDDGGAGGPRKRCMTARRAIAAIGPHGLFHVTGQVAKALEALVARGAAGVTSLEVDTWAYRLGAYVHNLRRDYGLTIETVREPHDGGWHGRYVLHSPVTIAEPGR